MCNETIGATGGLLIDIQNGILAAKDRKMVFG